MTTRRATWAAAGAAAAVLLAAMAWGLAHPASGPADAVLGRPAPDVVVQGLDGGRASLAGLRGRPVVLNFWASWCAPCRQEEVPLKAAAQRWEGRVAFLGVDFRDSPEAARATQERVQYPYPVGPAAAGVPAAYGVAAPPETFFLDARGLVVARFVGPLDGDLIDRYLQLVISPTAQARGATGAGPPRQGRGS
ncbi:MAG TPA: redoxin domain-containing protein [Candidatus Eisenbacteria bacterium]|nr:redoxin domain-containing protein [Candidatus Eisenbacteria bacterium]